MIGNKRPKGLIVGVANEDSLAWGCAKVLHDLGADIALTWLNDKARVHVEPLAESLNSPIRRPLDVVDDAQCQAVFDEIREKWGYLDFLIHSIAYAPKADLHGRTVDCSREGFMTAMDISCHSLIRLTRLAEPLMKDGGSVLTMSFYGAEKVVDNYNMMGPVKAALEASVRYMAVELGVKGVRVNALSPGPIKTRAASGLSDFDAMMERAAERAALYQLVTLEQVGEAAAFLVSDKSRHITGQVIYVDNGVNLRG